MLSMTESNWEEFSKELAEIVKGGGGVRRTCGAGTQMVVFIALIAVVFGRDLLLRNLSRSKS